MKQRVNVIRELKGFDLRDYGRILTRRKWLILIPALVLPMATFVVGTEKTTESYFSTAKIGIEPPKISPKWAKQVGLSEPEEIRREVEKEIRTEESLLSIAEGVGLVSDGKTGRSTKRAVSALAKGIKFKGKNSTVDIIFTHDDKRAVRAVANEIANRFIELAAAARNTEIQRTIDFFERQAAEGETDLNAKEDELAEFQAIHMGELPEQRRANLLNLSLKEKESENLEETVRILEEKKRQVEEDMANFTMEGTPEDPLFNRIQKERQELTDLLLKFTPKHPDVLRKQNRIDELEELARKRRERIEKGEELSDDTEAAKTQMMRKAKYRQLQAKLDDTIKQLDLEKVRRERAEQDIIMYRTRLENAPASELELRKLEREYREREQQYQQVYEKLLLARMNESLERENVARQFRIVQPASAPKAPKKKGLESGGARNMTNLLLIGLAVGLGLAVLSEILSQTFREPEDFEGLVDLPVIATISRIPMTKKEKLPMLRRRSG